MTRLICGKCGRTFQSSMLESSYSYKASGRLRQEGESVSILYVGVKLFLPIELFGKWVKRSWLEFQSSMLESSYSYKMLGKSCKERIGFQSSMLESSYSYADELKPFFPEKKFQSSMLESSYSYRNAETLSPKSGSWSFNPLCWSQVIPTVEKRQGEKDATLFQSSMLESSYSYQNTKTK